jgi:hypothetical protein
MRLGEGVDVAVSDFQDASYKSLSVSNVAEALGATFLSAARVPE